MGKKRKKFTVMAKIVVDASVEVFAEDLEEALEITRDFDTTHFIDFKYDGGHIDSRMRIQGVWQVDDSDSEKLLEKL